MKTLKIIVSILVILVAILVIVGISLPSKVSMKSTIEIDTPVKVVFKQVNNLKNWNNWSPWDDDDPEMVKTYEGPDEGVGAIYKLEGENAGTGTLTIIESVENKSLRNELVLMEGSTSYGFWKFEENEEGVKVTWGLEMIDMGFVHKFIGQFVKISMKPYFEKGLKTLKEYCEALPDEPEPNWSISEIEVMEMETRQALIIKDSATMDAMKEKFEELFGKLGAFIAEYEVEVAGPAFSKWYNYDTIGISTFEAGMIVTGEIRPQGNIQLVETYNGPVVTIIYKGSYENIEPAWLTIEKYIDENKKIIIGAPWEEYLVDPNMEQDSTKYVTQIFFPVK